MEAKRVERVNAMRVRDLGGNMSDRVILIYSGDLKRTRCNYRVCIAGALELDGLCEWQMNVEKRRSLLYICVLSIHTQRAFFTAFFKVNQGSTPET